MSEIVPVLKDEYSQRPIPSEWRRTFFDVVEAFREGDFRLERGILGVRPISEDMATQIAVNINEYGAHLAKLPADAWQTSVCQWMRGYWDALIDLFTIEEGASDLVLAIRIYEQDSTYSFEIQSVHVP